MICHFALFSVRKANGQHSCVTQSGTSSYKMTRQEQEIQAKDLPVATLAVVVVKVDNQRIMRPQVLLVTLGILVLLATLPLGKGGRFFSPPNFQNLLLLPRSLGRHGLARSTGCRRELGGRKSGAGRGHEREDVAVLRQVRPVPPDVPADVHLPGRFGARVPPGVQELRQVHRGQRQHQA